MTITLADLRKLPRSPALYELMRREWPVEKRRQQAQKALAAEDIQVLTLDAKAQLKKIKRDPRAVIKRRRLALVEEVYGHGNAL